MSLTTSPEPDSEIGKLSSNLVHEWIQAWNSHDLNQIMTHYAHDLIISSPALAKVLNGSGGTLRGLDAVRAYWEKALLLYPDLHFELLGHFKGVGSMAIHYRGVGGRKVVEVCEFNAEGLIARVQVLYA